MSKRWYNFFLVTDEANQKTEEPEPSSPPAPVQPPKANVQRVVDVMPDLQTETTFTSPVESPGSFDELYSSAQISSPVHGYTILKVAEMLQSEHIRTLPNDVKRKSIMVALDAAGVKVREIVEDAVQRDRALDTYEKVLQKHLEELRTEKDRENRRLEEEINQRLAELRTRIAENNKELSKEQETLMVWRTKKRQEEERIAEAVGYFVTENPVTTSGSSSGGAPQESGASQEKGGGENVR